MAFEELKERTAEVENQLHEYGEATAEYYKLKAFRLVMKGLLLMSKGFILGLLLSMILLFLSFSAAYAIGQSMQNLAGGFLVIAGIYLVVLLIVYLLREKINTPFLRKFSEYFYHSDDE